LFYIPNVERDFPPYVRYKEEFKDVLATERISMQAYIRGTRRSAVAFNTPSVCLCHGWKLAEYLAMGKAIISTPLSNVMPGEFVDGVHYRCCGDVATIEDVMKELRADESKRESLKQNAKAYFEEYLSPCAVVKRILDRAYLCGN
jgi:glycosyltransferase involved in cell wall biosynthesis